LRLASLIGALAELSGSLPTRSVRLVHQIIERAIKHAQAGDLVGRNVASLITAPEGGSGRSSRSLTLDQATAVLEAAQDSRTPSAGTGRITRPTHAFRI
jgi:hypothetical protein